MLENARERGKEIAADKELPRGANGGSIRASKRWMNERRKKKEVGAWAKDCRERGGKEGCGVG